MADEDLIFCLEGVDGGQTPRAGHDGDSEADSEDEEGYFICPITDDTRSHQNVNSKVNNYYGNLTKSEQYDCSGSPAGSFSFKVSGPSAPLAPAPGTCHQGWGVGVFGGGLPSVSKPQAAL